MPNHDYAKLAEELDVEAGLMSSPFLKPEVRTVLAHANDLMLRTSEALRAAEQDRKNVERFRLCIEHGWPSFHPPKQPTTSFKDPSKLIGKHEPAFWAMSTPWGLFYGDTAIVAIDSAISEEKPHG